jgi:hypothetical protein
MAFVLPHFTTRLRVCLRLSKQKRRDNEILGRQEWMMTVKMKCTLQKKINSSMSNNNFDGFESDVLLYINTCN